MKVAACHVENIQKDVTPFPGDVATSLRDLGLTIKPNRDHATIDLLYQGQWIGHRIYSGVPSERQIASVLTKMGVLGAESIQLHRPTGLPGRLDQLFDRACDIAKHNASRLREFAIATTDNGTILGYYVSTPGETYIMDREMKQYTVFADLTDWGGTGPEPGRSLRSSR